MRPLVFAIALSLLSLAGRGAAAEPPVEPQWRTVSSLQSAIRRTLERRLRDLDGRERREARVAIADVGESIRVVILRTPTSGTCGEFIYEIHRLQGATMFEVPSTTVCSSSLRLGPGNMDGVTDLRLVANEMVAAVWSWTGAGWAPFRLDEEPPMTARRPIATWDGLVRLAGSYEAADLVFFPEIDAALRRILGERHVVLLANVGVRGPMSWIDGCLVLEGLRPHAGGEEEAGVVACPGDRSVHVGLLTQGHVVVASTRPRDVALPERLAAWVRGRLPAEAPTEASAEGPQDGAAALGDLRRH